VALGPAGQRIGPERPNAFIDENGGGAGVCLRKGSLGRPPIHR
jgi:hypothetical protein